MWTDARKQYFDGIEKAFKNEVSTMFRATLTLNGAFVWSGLFETHPSNGEVIDRWRSEDKKSPTFDKLEVVKV
jgi:hypothetical protein